MSWPTHWAQCHKHWQMQMGPYEEQTNKAALATELEKNVSPEEPIRTPSTYIIDGMGLVQRMNGNNNTFAQLAESVLSMILYVGVLSGRVDVVFDAYRQPSIKYSERLNRGAGTTLQYQCLAGDTTYNSGDNSCAVHSTRRASSSYWLASENYSDTQRCCMATHCM